jgi:uncharacterized membrane protein YhaH (DUF805 family)
MDWRYLLLSMEGRITRRSFWLTILAVAVVSIIVRIIDGLIGSSLFYGTGILGIIFGLLMIYPAIALYAKRWHDRGKSGWWSLIGLIPIIGGIWLLIELGFLRGTVGANSYGPDPLQG